MDRCNLGDVPIPVTPPVRRALEAAVTLARKQGSDELRVRHLLGGLVAGWAPCCESLEEALGLPVGASAIERKDNRSHLRVSVAVRDALEAAQSLARSPLGPGAFDLFTAVIAMDSESRRTVAKAIGKETADNWYAKALERVLGPESFARMKALKARFAGEKAG